MLSGGRRLLSPCQASMKASAVTFWLLCSQFETLCGADICSSRLCKNIDRPHVSDPQLAVDFSSGDFKLTFHNPKNVSEFSMTLFKGHEKQRICALHVDKGKVFPESNVTYCNAEHSNSSTTFILKNLGRKHTGIYTCCLEMFLPPPYIECRLNETYLYIPDEEKCISPGLMSGIVIGLTAFAMISCICGVVVCCLRNKNQQYDSSSHEYNSEYMPMAAVNAAKKPRI